MIKQKTKELENILKQVNKKEKDQIFKGIKDSTFLDYINQLLFEKKLEKSEVIKLSQIPRTYAYQIFQGNKQAGRDKTLQLAIAMNLNIEETNRLLTLAQHNGLYAKHQRDAILIFAISNHYDLIAINELLDEYHHVLLGDFS